MAGRFILLDPAIKGLTGHFYQYAAHVLEAARAGFTPVLATNRALDIADVPFEVHPVFRYSFQLNRAEFPGLAALAHLTETVGRVASRFAPRERPPTGSATPSGAPGLGSRLALRLVTRLKIHQFARDLRQLFRHRPLAAGDVVLIPTAGEIEVLGLDRYLTAVGRTPGVRWHLLFHFPLFHGREPDHPAQRPDLVRGGRAFIAAVGRLRGHGVRFSTDTEELTRQYERVAGPPFAVLPIPHTTPAAGARAPAACPRVCYLGDARVEKGFHHLPRVVDALWDDVIAPGRAVFTLQANDNGVRENAPVSAAREALARHPADKVELIRRPLTPAEYEALLHRCDIALLPYDPDAYYARSSGIMTEALAAGITVIVPDGSWLARQFADCLQDHIRQVRQDVPLRAATECGPEPSAPRASAVDGEWRGEAQVPTGARLLAGRITSAHTGPGVFLKARLEWCDGSGATVARRHALVSSPGTGEAPWFLVRVGSGATRVRLSVRGLWSGGEPGVTGCRLEFRGADGAEPVPISRVGVAWSDPEDLPELVREVLDHYPHYCRTAGAFAATFFRTHNVTRYLERLLTAGEAG